MDRYRLPFDQYQRYEDLRRIVEHYPAKESGKPLRILDIGGYLASEDQIGYLPVHDFLSPEEAWVVDVNQTCSERFVRGSGAALPFRNGIFDVVTAQDTLEHIPVEQREAFLAEAARVSGSLVVISGPCFQPATEMAEQYLADFLRDLLDGSNPCLDEHLKYGLPHLSMIRGFFEERGYLVECIPSGSLHAWLQMMLLKHFLYTIEGSHTLHVFLDRYYNQFLYQYDHFAPSYRMVVLAGPSEFGSIFRQLRDHFSVNSSARLIDREAASLVKMLEIMALHLEGLHPLPKVFELQKVLAARDKSFQALHQIVGDKDSAMARLQNLVDRQGHQINELQHEREAHRQRIHDMERTELNLQQHIERMKRREEELQLSLTHLANLEAFRDKVQESLPYRLHRLLKGDKA